LRYFVAVAEHLHFGRAAEALVTAQPSLSRQILQLEDELGVQLFDRTNRRVELTAAGRLFLSDARKTLQAADASLRHVRENADGTRGELRIAFISGAMLMMLPSILRDYRRRFPNVTVTPNAMPYPDHVGALRAGIVDVAWTIAPADADIVSQTVTRDGFLAVMPAGHPLSKRSTIDLKMFGAEPLIVLDRSIAPVLYDDTLHLCARAGYRPAEFREVQDEMSVLGLVAAGFGVALAPYPWSAIHMRGIVFRDLTEKFYIDEALSWHRDRDTPIVRSFVETALEILKQRPADAAAMPTEKRRARSPR
jgi:DNA-binding transcriptional LysR family regulator